MTRDELLKLIRTDRRQLERYLFYFEKDDQGDFVPSDRLKMDVDQMEQPGVVADLSLKDLLLIISGREKYFSEWYQHHKFGKDFHDFHPELSPTEIDQIDRFILAEMRDQCLNECLEGFRASHRQILEIIEVTSDEELPKAAYDDQTSQKSLSDLIGLMTWETYRWGKGCIRTWVKTGSIRMDKEQMLESIETERRRLEKNLANYTDQEMIEPGVIGEWSIKDILAHLVDWEQRFLGWYRAGLRGEIPHTPAPGMTWRDLDRLNREIYEENKERALSSVQSNFHSSYTQVFEIIQSIPEPEIFASGHYAWTQNSNLAAFIMANTANHYRWAKTQIRKWERARHE